MSSGCQEESSRDTGTNRRLDPPAVFVLDPRSGPRPFTGAPTWNPETEIMPNGGEKGKEKAKKTIDALLKSRYNISSRIDDKHPTNDFMITESFCRSEGIRIDGSGIHQGHRSGPEDRC